MLHLPASESQSNLSTRSEGLTQWGASYLAWLARGRGPHRAFGATVAFVPPRGLPAGGFWRRNPLPPDLLSGR